ncbi:MAG: leucine-rich repeat domain-containing protein [Bacilli bacterium]|nr:leucine-rich repeat domain-containing protein [Bacilli bacterium]
MKFTKLLSLLIASLTLASCSYSTYGSTSASANSEASSTPSETSVTETSSGESGGGSSPGESSEESSSGTSSKELSPLELIIVNGELVGLSSGFDHESIVIPDTVTSIAKHAFRQCSVLKAVEVSSTVNHIEYSAFSGCSSLESITLPFVGESATSNPHLGYIFGAGSYLQNASYVPSGLKSVTVLEGCVSIGDSAFSGCASLTSVTIPSSVASIGDSAFRGCSSLESLTVPFVGGSAGSNTRLDYIFGDSSYVPSSLKSVVILEGCKSIGDSAFKGCSSLKSIVIPSGVASIGKYAFSGCSSLESIVIPSSVASIGDLAFSGCSSLTSVTLPSVVAPSSESSSQPSSSSESSSPSTPAGMTAEQKIDAVIAALSKPEAALGNLHMKNVEKQIYINDQGEEVPDHAYIKVKEADIADNKAKLTLTQAMPMSGAEFVAEASSLFESITATTPIADAVALFNEEAGKKEANPMIKGYTAEIDGENVNVFSAPKTNYRVVTETDYINIGIPSGKTKLSQQSYSLAYLAKKDEQDIGLIPNISPLRLARHADEIKAQALSIDEASGKLTVDLTKVGKLLDSPMEGSATVEFSPASILNIAADVVVNDSYNKYRVISTWEFSNFGQVSSVTLPNASEIETCDHETTYKSKLDDEEHYTRCGNCNSVISVEPHSFDNDLCYVCHNSVYEEIDYPVSLGENLEVTVTLHKGSNTHVFDQSNLEVHYQGEWLPLQGAGTGNDTYDLQVEQCDVGEEGKLFIRLYREYALAEGDDPCLYDAADTVEYYFYSKDEEKEGVSKLEDALMEKTVPAEAHYTKKGQIAVGQGQVHRHKEHFSYTKIEGDLYHVEATCEVCGKVIESYDAELK